MNKLRVQDWLQVVAAAIALAAFSFIYFMSAYEAYAIGRFIFNFPRWVYANLLNPFGFDRERYGFLFFQLPNIWRHYTSGGDFLSSDYFYNSVKYMNIMLSLHAPLAYALILGDALRRRAFDFALAFLASMGVLYLPAAAISFNGSVQAHSFFWALAYLQLYYLPQRKWVSCAIYLGLWPIFMTLYPPFAIMGSLVLTICAWTQRELPRFIRYLNLGGLIAILIYFYVVQSNVQSNNTGETYFAIRMIGLDWGLKFILPASLGALFALGALYWHRWRFLLWALALVSLLSFYFLVRIYLPEANWHFASYPIYYRRIFVYTIAPIYLIVFYALKKLIAPPKDLSPVKTSISFLIILAISSVGLYMDQYASERFFQNMKEIKTILAAPTLAAERCLDAAKVIDMAKYEHASFHLRDWPFYSLLAPDFFNHKFLYYEKIENLHGWSLHISNDQAISEYCNGGGDEDAAPIVYRFFHGPY